MGSGFMSEDKEAIKIGDKNRLTSNINNQKKRQKQEELRHFLDQQVQQKKIDKTPSADYGLSAMSFSAVDTNEAKRQKQIELHNFLNHQVQKKEENKRLMKQAEHARYKIQPDPRNNHHSKAIPSFSNDFHVTNQEAQNFAREKEMMKRIKQDEYKSSLDAQLKSKSRMEEQSKYGKVFTSNNLYISPEKPGRRYAENSEYQLLQKKNEQEDYRRALERQVDERKMRLKRQAKQKVQEEERVFKEM